MLFVNIMSLQNLSSVNDKLAERLYIECEDATVQAVFDKLCRCLVIRGVPFSFLSPVEGNLISNISVAENICLPLIWHCRGELEEVENRIKEFLTVISSIHKVEEERILEILQARPYELGLYEHDLALILRVFIRKPKVIVIDPEWFMAINSSIWHSCELLSILFGQLVWIVPINKPSKLPRFELGCWHHFSDPEDLMQLGGEWV